jgi:hypothetical protein
MSKEGVLFLYHTGISLSRVPLNVSATDAYQLSNLDHNDYNQSSRNYLHYTINDYLQYSKIRKKEIRIKIIYYAPIQKKRVKK